MLTLTLVALASYAGLNLPAVSYIKCLDIWSIACLLFVAAALLDCVIIDFLLNLHNKQSDNTEEMKIKRVDELMGNKMEDMEDCVAIEILEDVKVESKTEENHAQCSVPDMKRKYRRIAVKVKCVSRVIFPLLFLIFNVSFWYMYTRGSGSFYDTIFW